MIEKLMMNIGLIDQVTKPLQGITKQINSAMDTGKQGLQDMAVGGAGVVATGFAIQNALMPAIEMDRKLGEVKSLGVTDDALKTLQQTALEFSAEYGKSAADFVGASYDIQSAIAGLNGTELSQFTKASGVLAAATKADTATITSYMGTMYGIFKNQAAEMGNGAWVEQVAGMTASAVQMFKTTGSEMSSAFTSVGANATSAGIAMSEQMAILGTLQATMSGSEAGTKYKAFLSGVAQAQGKLNLSFVDSQGKMLPMLDILDKLKGKFGDTLDVAEAADLKKAFGSDEAVSMIKLLMADTNGLASSIESLGQVKGMTKAEEMAAAMTDQWERLESSWFAIRAAAFGAILPAINAIVGSIADGITYVTALTDQFPILTQIMSYAAIGALSLGGVVALLSIGMGAAKMMSAGWALTMSGLSGVMKIVSATTKAMVAVTWLFNAALWANPVTWVIAGIVALAAAVGAMIYWWDDLKASFGDTAVFKFLADTIDWVIDKLNMIPGIDIEWRAGEMPQSPGAELAQKAEKTAAETAARQMPQVPTPEQYMPPQQAGNVVYMNQPQAGDLSVNNASTQDIERNTQLAMAGQTANTNNVVNMNQPQAGDLSVSNASTQQIERNTQLAMSGQTANTNNVVNMNQPQAGDLSVNNASTQDIERNTQLAMAGQTANTNNVVNMNQPQAGDLSVSNASTQQIERNTQLAMSGQTANTNNVVNMNQPQAGDLSVSNASTQQVERNTQLAMSGQTANTNNVVNMNQPQAGDLSVSNASTQQVERNTQLAMSGQTANTNNVVNMNQPQAGDLSVSNASTQQIERNTQLAMSGQTANTNNVVYMNQSQAGDYSVSNASTQEVERNTQLAMSGQTANTNNVVNMDQHLQRNINNQSENNTAIDYAKPENAPALSPNMVNNMNSSNSREINNIRQFGDVYISAENGLTPDEIAEWDELNAG